MWDSIRKSLSLAGRLLRGRGDIEGWRKMGYWKKKAKNSYEAVRRNSQRGGKYRDPKLKAAVRQYVKIAKEIGEKLHSLEQIVDIVFKEKMKRMEIEYYIKMVYKHIDLLERRILKSEKIPHAEKVFSIFEPYTEWISKGKANRAVELGVKVCIASDNYGYILKHEVMEKQEDVTVIVPITKWLLKKYKIRSLSCDKGFWSLDNYTALEKLVQVLVMPKKGKCNQAQREREHTEEFIRLRKRHSAVESNINALEHHGGSRCPDRGVTNFRNYVALSVLSYNLHLLGNSLLEQDRLALRKTA